MKTGTILYITGNEPVNTNLTKTGIFNQLKIKSDYMEFVSDKSGHADIHDAWFSLTVRGMHLINCRIATFNSYGKLELSSREMRLKG